MKKNIYLCGPTVYNSPHIGNMRPIITFDIFIRSFRELNQEVNFIHNITDIDDKIIDKSIELNKTEDYISRKYTLEYLGLLSEFNIQKPNKMPKVTENIEEIIHFINELIQKKIAYISNGSVYFSVEKDKLYGKISNRKINKNLIQKNNSEKNNLLDFVLWKKTNKGISFNSPWSNGRPGWHTECSVFINNYLKGESLDIHSGGVDLLFPHHENEATQYRMLNNKEISKKWVHVGQLFINGEKMSKSLNNSFLAKDFLKKYEPDVLRLLFFSSSVTGPIYLKEDLLNQIIKKNNQFKKIFLKAQMISNKKYIKVKEFCEYIINWNFSKANSLLNYWIKEFNKENKYSNEIIFAFKTIGFNFSNIQLSQKEIEIYNKWIELRKQKKFEESDKIREKLFKLKLI